MRLLLDTNVLLDALLGRSGAKASGEIIASCPGVHTGFIAWHGLATIFYLASKAKSAAFAQGCVKSLLSWAHVADTGHADALRAIGYPMFDFEDALQAAAAEASGAVFIITRNGKDFANSPVPALTPEDFLLRFPLV